MDRIMMTGGIDVLNVVISETNTTDATDLFSPSGGSIAAPSVSLANDPINDTWQYDYALLSTLGQARLAMLSIAQGVCNQINAKADALDVTVGSYNVATVTDPTSTTALGDLTDGSWPTALSSGQLMGCIDNTGTDGKYWFYQVIALLSADSTGDDDGGGGCLAEICGGGGGGFIPGH